MQHVDILEAVDGLDALELATEPSGRVLMDISMPSASTVLPARRPTCAVPWACKVIRA